MRGYLVDVSLICRPNPSAVRRDEYEKQYGYFLRVQIVLIPQLPPPKCATNNDNTFFENRIYKFEKIRKKVRHEGILACEITINLLN